MEYTKGEPDLIEKARAESIEFYGMAGRGATAPGAVVLRQNRSIARGDSWDEWAVHFANTQLGGYHGGNYCSTLKEAQRAFRDRVENYDRDGELNRVFLRHERESA